MIRSIYTGATGMESQELYMDVISNNLSNVNTNGFKRTKIEFQDLMYQTIREPGVRNPEGGMAPSGIEVGLGSRAAATTRIFEQGSLNQTGNPLDIAIKGEGFYQIEMPDGTISYTRDGQFKLSSDGTLVTSSGFPLYPPINIPEQSEELTVDDNGNVSVILAGEETSTHIGQIELARFINPGGLRSLGSNLFGMSDASGLPIINMPGEEGTGTLGQKYVETSNVSIVDEMVNMITAQRAYEIVSKSIQSAEEMLNIASGLKR